MFKRVISTCMAVVLTSTAFFNASKNDSINTMSTYETTVTQTSGDIITSEEALTEAGIITEEAPEETKPAGDDGAASAPTQAEAATETPENDADEAVTTEAEDIQNARTTDLPETDEEYETELYAAGSCTVVRTGSYTALGAPGHTFSTEIDGVTYSAVCCDSSKGSTNESGAAYNLDGIITKDPSSMIYKTLYYSYVGPEPYSFSDTAEAVIVTARNLSYYMNNDGVPGNNYYKWLQNAATPPSHDFALSSTDASLSDVTYENKTYQGSNWITLQMDESLTAKLDAPSDVIILLKDKDNNVTKENGATGIEIEGGESFRVLGDKSLNGDKKVSLHYDGDKMIVVKGLSPATDASLQRLLYIDREHPSESITFQFEGLGALKINKKSADESITKNNDCYSFEGIEYSLYADGKKQVLATFVMNKEGQGAVGEITAAGTAAGISKEGTDILMLPLGKYDVKETKTNGHYNMDPKVYDVTIKDAYNRDNPASVHVETYSNTPKMDPVAVEITKQNKEGDTVKGATDLEGAQYTIKYYAGDYSLNNLPASATRTWVIKTKYNNITNSYNASLTKTYLVSGDDFYLDELGIPLIPHGTITIQETKAPAGYKLDGAKLYLTGASAKDNPDIEISGDVILAKITDEGLNIRVNSSNSVDVDSAAGINILQTEEMIRGDFAFTKKDYRTGEGMAYIPFLMESKTTGEKHVICTDENGAFSTAAAFKKHTENTNGNDALMDEEIIGDIQSCGTWFYGNEKEESNTGADDARGALPYDTYVITELLCERNRDYQLADPFEITVDSEGVMANQPELVNVPNPELKTTAWTGTMDNHTAGFGENIILTDTCEYFYLTAGTTYTIHSVMVDAAGNPVKDASGSYIEAVKVFTVEDAYNVSRYEKCGSIDVSCTVNSTEFSSFTGTFFEYLGSGDTSSVSIIDANGNINVTSMNVVAAHADLTDTSQQIEFIMPYIKTYVRDKADGNKEIKAGDKEIIITDTVSYFNLEPGEYVISGYLMDKATNKPLMINGEKITVTKAFQSDASGNGTVDVDYIFAASAVMEGKGSKDIVVFEELYLADAKTLVCEHKDIDDEDQTVHISTQPKTGDMNHPSVIFSIAVLCFLGIIMLIKIYRKKNLKKGN